jgi:iron complex outermembrane receptor protein
MLEFALGVTNLTDKQYYTLAFRCVGGRTSSIYPEDGRAFTGSVRIQF